MSDNTRQIQPPQSATPPRAAAPVGESLAGPGAAAGPLVVSTINPRYFMIASGDTKGKLVYLTGAHINNNFHDGLGPGAECADPPEHFEYQAYLAFLQHHGHNFARLWRWEQFRSQLAGGGFHFCATPQPWPRTGPGTATDGKPTFDLTQFDTAYFDRLRRYVADAGKQGIYVSVMLFEGFGLHLTPPPDNIAGHPFHEANNVNGIGISSIIDYQVLPLDARVQALQEAYIRKVVDTVHDLPNVLYEVANESSGDTADAVHIPDGPSIPTPIGDSTEWQYWVITFLKQYEQQMGYTPHPVGMSYLYPVPELHKANDPLWASPADWVSPGFDDQIGNARWRTNPPANDGAKVILSDTDHYSPFGSDALWAWKSLLRGHHPVLYDFGIIDVVHPLDPSFGVPSYESYEPARLAMGDTRRYAERVQLSAMQPRGDLSSTGYALANPGHEYLVLQPSEAAELFTVELAAGTYAVEWYGVTCRETVEVEPITVESAGAISFTAPFEAAGSAVIYLKETQDA
jgi:hypothetical protein